MPSHDKHALASFCHEAYISYPDSCSHSVYYVIQKYRIDQPYMIANALIDHIANSYDWHKVKVIEIADLASEGILVVGGLKEDGHGHVVVVYPGSEKTSGGYQFKKRSGEILKMPERGSFPRAMSTSMGRFPGAKSDGDKTVWDAWGDDEKFKKVQFWKYVGVKPIPEATNIMSSSRWEVSGGHPMSRHEALDKRGSKASESLRWRIEADSLNDLKLQGTIIRWQR